MSKLAINNDCLRTDIDDETIILNTSTGKYLKLNSTSKFILECIEKNLDLNEIVKEINSYYEVTEIDAKSSLERFINIAIRKNIIVKKTS